MYITDEGKFSAIKHDSKTKGNSLFFLHLEPGQVQHIKKKREYPKENQSGRAGVLKHAW